MAGVVIAAALGLFLFTSLPASQRWLAEKVAKALSEKLQTRVEIGRARIGLFNRVVIDDVILFDQSGDTLLRATRMGAKLSWADLATDRLHISAAQLFGFDIRLRRSSPEEPYNFQFIIDNLASKDTTSSTLNFALSNVVVRRGRLSHDVLSVPKTHTFSPSHFILEDLRLALSADTITERNISASINELSFSESSSGLALKGLSLHAGYHLTADGEAQISVGDLRMQLPDSRLQLPTLSASLRLPSEADSTALRVSRAEFQLQGQLTPSDLVPFLPSLSAFDEVIAVDATGKIQDGQLNITDLRLASEDLALHTSGDVTLPPAFQEQRAERQSLAAEGMPLQVQADLHHLYISKTLTRRVTTLLADGGIINPSLQQILQRLGNIVAEGHVNYAAQNLGAEVRLQTSTGASTIKGRLWHADTLEATVQTKDVLLADIFTEKGDFPLNHLTAEGKLNGSLRKKTLQGTLVLHHLLAFSEDLALVETNFDFSPNNIQGQLALSDDHYGIFVDCDLRSPRPMLSGPEILDELSGKVELENFYIRTEEKAYQLTGMSLALDGNAELGRSIALRGDFIEAEAQGRFSLFTLLPGMQQALHRVLPSFVPPPATGPQTSDDQLKFRCSLLDKDQFQTLADIDLHLPGPCLIEGDFDARDNRFQVLLDAPHVLYASEDLRNIALIAQCKADSLDFFMTAQRMMETGPLDLSITADAEQDVLTSVLSWDDHNIPVQQGKFAWNTRFHRDSEARLLADMNIKPTELVVADSTWQVLPATINLTDSGLLVHDFQISQHNRHLKIDGRVSSNPADTIYADLHNIDLQYVFGIIDFHDVEFAGEATGKVKVTNFSSIPYVGGRLSVDNFKLNEGPLGHLSLDIGFGRKDDRAIDIDGLIHDPQTDRISHVTGLVKPGRELHRGMDLHIYADKLSTYFINDFTKGILERIEGRVTGYARISGPFSLLDLDGQLRIDTLSFGLPVLGTRYHCPPGDSIFLSPDGIRFADVHIFDSMHGSDRRDHEATVNGVLHFRHFDNLRYEFDIQAHDFLGYDFSDFGDQSFYGTALATGRVSLSGQPGQLNVDIQCTPTAGTVFTYNVSTPLTTTDADFVTFRSATHQKAAASDSIIGSASTLLPTDSAPSDEDEPIDMHINFDLDITPAAQMRLLMDPRSEDYITLWGNGRIRANFFNKGTFQMYGTYRIDHGNYRLSLQDVIRKEFQFEPGSSIVFGGNPMQGDLNLRAIYTVPGVNLNDLAVGSNFSNSSVRVNCIMNVGGRAENPQISFDFDIPNVNEDEKQMVRTLISTDEERNLQVIYLLGIGRFFTQDLGSSGNQTNSAMQGLLSSTLSGQLNNVLSNVINNKNWNFGTTFSTGQLGWQDMDVEGSLSGRLLGNRLLVNGTFGYRDTPVANTNFIGDFDVRWLVNKSGTVSLKAYSETNDRYFTKSALTTQGIGIQLKKDFTNLRDLFLRR